jgi:hypothetical protein
VGTFLSFLALGFFAWMVLSGIESEWAGFWALVLAALGLRAVFFLPGLVLSFFQYLHYLFVPHPAEERIRRVIRSSSPNRSQLEGIADAMYDPVRDGSMSEWEIRNRRRRIMKAAALMAEEGSALNKAVAYAEKKTVLKE